MGAVTGVAAHDAGSTDQACARAMASRRMASRKKTSKFVAQERHHLLSKIVEWLDHLRPARPQPGPTAQTGTAGPSVEPQGAGQPGTEATGAASRATRCQHCPQQETFRGCLRRPHPPIERNLPTSVPSRVLILLVPDPPGCTPAAGRQLDMTPTPRRSSLPPESKRGCGWDPTEFSSPRLHAVAGGPEQKTHHVRGPTSKQANRMKKRNSLRQ